jgi:hypothetical protein
MKWLFPLAIAFLLAPSWVVAQEADPWQKKKADSFRPLTDAQKSAIENAVPGQATAAPKKERRVLMFYRCEGFIHGSIPYGNYAVESMAKKTKAFTVDLADTYDVFTPENLARCFFGLHHEW